MRNSSSRTLLTVSLLFIVWEFVTILYSSSAQAGGGREVVIPFWNIAAKRKAYKNRNQVSNHTIDYCIDASAAEESDAIFQQPQRTHVTTLHYRGGSKEAVADAATSLTRVDEGYKPLKTGHATTFEFSLFQHGDGSDEDVNGIPTRFLLMHNGNRELAHKAVLATLQWRKEKDINTILKRPHPFFDIAKAVFPHYFLASRDTMGHVIFVQRPALLNLKLAAKNNLSPALLLDHYIYVNEYLWQILDSRNALATMTSILDLHGLNFKYIREKEIVNFMKEFVKTMDSHYPQRAHKTLIVNAPKWFHVLYKIVSPLLRESTKSKIEIYTRGKRQDKALKTWLGNDQAEKLLPASFFSKKKQHKNKVDKRKHDRKMMKESSEEEDLADDEENEEDLPSPDENAHLASSQFEIDLRTFTMERLRDAGAKMLEVKPL